MDGVRGILVRQSRREGGRVSGCMHAVEVSFKRLHTVQV